MRRVTKIDYNLYFKSLNNFKWLNVHCIYHKMTTSCFTVHKSTRNSTRKMTMHYCQIPEVNPEYSVWCLEYCIMDKLSKRSSPSRILNFSSMFSNVRTVHTIQYKQLTIKIPIFWKQQELPVVNFPFPFRHV